MSFCLQHCLFVCVTVVDSPRLVTHLAMTHFQLSRFQEKCSVGASDCLLSVGNHYENNKEYPLVN